MWTVKEISKRAGVSIRTLHYYDSIGLLRPVGMSESGYRLYDDTSLERLQCILLFRELQFPLKEIRQILDSPHFDRNRALEQQIELLRLKKERLETLIDLARGIQMMGVNQLDFSAFDTRRIDDYAAQAKAAWGTTEAYREFEEKAKGRTREEEELLSGEIMGIFRAFGAMRDTDPAGPRAQQQVQRLKEMITAHFYTCTPEILRSLGVMYTGGGSMTDSIERAGGSGTAEFVRRAIEAYCG